MNKAVIASSTWLAWVIVCPGMPNTAASCTKSGTEEHAKNLPRYYDPLIVAGDDLELFPMVEEELILSLPIVPYHDDCSVQTSFGDVATTDNETDKPNPFSVLASLKADK